MPVVVVTAALLLVGLASHVVPPRYGRDAPPHFVPLTSSAPVRSNASSAGGLRGAARGQTHPFWTAVAADVLLGVIALGLVWGLVTVLLTRFRSGRRERRRRVGADTGVAAAALARRIEDAVDDGLDELAQGPVTDAIIACWQRLEDAAASAGVAPRRSDTPTETVVRVLGAGRARAAPLQQLADLYREARFSRHEMAEPARAAARAALEQIRADLAHREPVRDVVGAGEVGA